MQNILCNKFNFEESDEIEIIDWDIDYIFFSGQCEEIFCRTNTLFNQFRGTVYKNSILRKMYSNEEKRSVLVIGNFGLKYTFGFEEYCGFSFVEKLASSNIKNEGFSIVANFMIENFPKRRFLVFGHGQKDDAITFDQINTLFVNYGPLEVALAAHIKSKQRGK